MKVFKYIFFLLLLLIIGLAIYVAVQPNDYEFERSRTIKAPASLLYNSVNDFKNWPKFSPWIEKDPNAKLSYGKITSGTGGSYSWVGEELGEGNMKTIIATKDKSIQQLINFITPFEGSANIDWNFTPKEDGTKVTWKMNGKQDFMTKLFTTFMGSIESTTGPDFERGLFKLDSITQSDMKKYNVAIKGITQHSGGFYLYNTTSTKMSNFKNEMQQQFPKIGAYAVSNNITMAGKPFVLYEKWDEANDAVIFSCCIPTSSKIESNQSDVLTGQLPSFKAVKTILTGDYENLKEAWEKTMAYITENNLEVVENGPMLETYLTDPSQNPNPASWITEIYIAIK